MLYESCDEFYIFQTTRDMLLNIIIILIFVINVALSAHIMDDMILTEQQYNQIAGIRNSVYDDGSFASGINNEAYRWPDGQMPYVFSNSFASYQKNIVKDEINYFNDIFDGCLKIRPKNDEDSHHVVLENEGTMGCGSSNVGKLPGAGKQTIRIVCFRRRTILHEFIHAFGFTHEQNRPDRDDYVEIHEDNIDPAAIGNFQKDNGYEQTYFVRYDFKSIMHYHTKAFSKNGYQKTITSKIPGISDNEISSEDMTPSDILKLKRMYGCDPLLNYLERVKCPDDVGREGCPKEHIRYTHVIPERQMYCNFK